MERTGLHYLLVRCCRSSNRRYFHFLDNTSLAAAHAASLRAVGQKSIHHKILDFPILDPIPKIFVKFVTILCIVQALAEVEQRPEVQSVHP